MTTYPRIFRITSGLASAGFLIATAFVLVKPIASLPTIPEIAVAFGQPLGQRLPPPEETPAGEMIVGSSHMDPARIRASQPAATESEIASSELESSGLEPFNLEDEPASTTLQTAESMISANVGDHEGENYALPDLGVLTPAVVDRLLVTGMGVLVAQLGDGRHLMFTLGSDHTLQTGQVVDWSETAGNYSLWELNLPTRTEVVPMAVLQTLLRRAIGPHTLSKLSIVLSVEAEQELIEAQKDLIARSGWDYGSLLSAGTSVVTTGCWLDGLPMFRLSSLQVEGHRRHRNCRSRSAL